MIKAGKENWEIYQEMGISKEVYDYCDKIWNSLKPRWEEIDILSEYNQLKVIHAMQKNQVSEACLLGTTGYGYSDLGRETLERVYADIFHTEEALVRPLWNACPCPCPDEQFASRR